MFYSSCLLLPAGLLLLQLQGHVTTATRSGGKVVDDDDWWWNSVMLRRLVDSRRVVDESAQQQQLRSQSASIEKKTASGRAKVEADKFLMQFGYLQQLPAGVGHDEASKRAAIKKFQKFYNLPETGVMDEATQQAMLHPRCGVPDTQPTIYTQPSDTDDNGVAKRYIPGTRKWHHKDLTYRHKNYASTRSLDTAAQRNAIKRAFDVWSEVTPLTFVEVPDRGDINIEFASKIHSDGAASQFDGPGGVLAHAYYPESGELHMDDDENWNVDKDVDMMSVAAHELGHALGLPHSNDPEALMAPYYKGYDPEFQLSSDDIQAIQFLYGSNPNPGVSKKPPEPTRQPTTVPPTTTRPPPVVTMASGEADTCNIAFRATMQIHDNSVMVFSGQWLWRLTDDGLDQGFPVLSRTVYPRAPDNVDAAVYSTSTYYTYLFYGRNVWKYYGYEYIEGRVVATKDFAGSVSDVITGSDGKIYLVKGAKCWQFDEATTSVLPRPPNCSTLFPSMPMNFNSTVRLEQDPTHIFLFSGPNYYKYSTETRSIERGYPKAKAGPWMGSVCGGQPGNPK